MPDRYARCLRCFGALRRSLAIRSGAAILPAFFQLLPGGRIQLCTLPALSWDTTGGRGTQICEILALYAAVKAELWRQAPGALHHNTMREHLACKLAAGLQPHGGLGGGITMRCERWNRC